jgi:hypothetical protein
VEQNDGELIIKTAISKKTSLNGNLIKELEINRKSQIILNGDFDAELIKGFSDKDIKYVRTAQSLIRDVDITTDKLNFIYVASKDRTILKSLFQISEKQSDEMIAILNKVELNPQSKLIDNELGLMLAIRTAKK